MVVTCCDSSPPLAHTIAHVGALRGRLYRGTEALLRVTVDGAPVELTATEYAVLCELSVHAPQTPTHTVLLQHIWGPEKVGEPWLLRTVVKLLRRKLRDDAADLKCINTEPRVGYRMTLGRSGGEE